MRSVTRFLFAVAVFAASVAHAESHDVQASAGFTSSTQLGGGGEEVTPLDDYFWMPGMNGASFDGTAFSKGTDQTLGERDAPFNFDHTLVYECGQRRAGITTKCGAGTQPSTHPAPEMDVRFATQGVMLLVGGLLILRGRIGPKARAAV